MRRTGRSGSVEEGISLFSTPPLSQDHEQIQAEIADERALRNYERAAMGNASARATTHASARRLSRGTVPRVVIESKRWQFGILDVGRAKPMAFETWS
jgi:hypothetical protein